MVQGIQSKLLMAEIIIGLKKLELPGLDLSQAKAFSKAAQDVIAANHLGYGLVVATKAVIEDHCEGVRGHAAQAGEELDMKIEVLYIEGCPYHRLAVDEIADELRAHKINASVEELEVTDSTMAEELRFLGSPSIRIDGLDIEPEARKVQSFGFGCRTYSDSAGRRSGLPAIGLIRQALLEASISEAAAGRKT
jgi:hypothetical protein